MFKIEDMKFNLKNIHIDKILLKKRLVRVLYLALFIVGLILGLILIIDPVYTISNPANNQSEKMISYIFSIFSFLVAFFSLRRLFPDLEIRKIKEIKKETLIKCLKPIIIFLFIILLISLIIFLYNYYYGGKVRLITVNKDLPVSHILTNDDLNFEYLDFDLVPTSTITEKNKIIGQTIIFPLSKGEIITHKYLNSKINPETLATLVPYGKFGLMLNSDLFSAPLPKIEVNDFITIIGSSAFENNKDGILISDKVYFVEYNEKGNPRSFFLALTSEEIETINISKLTRGSLILIVNSHD